MDLKLKCSNVSECTNCSAGVLDLAIYTPILRRKMPGVFTRENVSGPRKEAVEEFCDWSVRGKVFPGPTDWHDIYVHVWMSHGKKPIKPGESFRSLGDSSCHRLYTRQLVISRDISLFLNI
jgi:hypothetical protein